LPSTGPAAFRRANEELDGGRDHALLWIEENQLGRRNLSDDQRAAISVRVIERKSKLVVQEHSRKAAEQRWQKERELACTSDTSSDVHTPAAPVAAEYRFRCLDCGEMFPTEAWHCLGCDHHHGTDRAACNNCYKERRRPMQPKTLPPLTPEGRAAIWAEMTEDERRDHYADMADEQIAPCVQAD
jgi:hypothetical protein